MSPQEFVSRHPNLYHMAERGSWESIRERGLLSTTALLDLFAIAGPRRQVIESAHRPESIKLSHPQYGVAVVRDQKPMSETKLRSCLIGMEPREWYELLNRKVFLWPTKERVAQLLSARAYRDSPHVVIEVNTSILLEQRLNQTTLSRINSGSTLYAPVSRSRETFLPLSDYPQDWWRKRRLGEVAVDYGIPSITDMVTSVEEWEGTTRLQTMWRR
jgi:sulfur carrier protein ThiS